jgi:trk system potassium uptake protein TrkH
MHFRAITRIVGLLVILFSGTMIVPGLVALLYRDGAGRAFSQTFIMALIIGALLWWPNRKQKKELKPREGFLIVVLFWTVLGSVGAMPFIFSEHPNLSVTDAFFESFSGLTTTGATTLVGLDSLPKARCCNGLVAWESLCSPWRSCLFLASAACSSTVRKCPVR